MSVRERAVELIGDVEHDCPVDLGERSDGADETDRFLGIMDDPAVAARVVELHNAAPGTRAPDHAAVDGERPFREQTAGEAGLTRGTRSDGDAARWES